MKELHLKYRPKSLDELVGQSSVVATLKEMIRNKRVPHVLLLAGPSGTGKTTTARILQKHLSCDKLDFHEINCADFRGIDMIREIRSNMNLHPFGKSRIYLIDEAGKLTGDAQASALKILEDTPSHCYFFLCTTDPEKLLATVRNRCTKLVFKTLTPKEMTTLLTTTAEKENVEISEKVIERIIEVAEGSPRLGMNLLNRILHLESEDEQLDAVIKSDGKRVAFDLCKALLWGRANWSEVAKIIQGVEEEPESIRRLILSTASAEVLKGTKLSGKAYAIVCAFESNWYDSGRAGLVRACYEVLNSK